MHDRRATAKNGEGGRMNYYQKITEMSLTDLANEFVVPFTYSCGYRAQTTFRSVHTGCDYNSREEALDSEICYLRSEVEG